MRLVRELAVGYREDVPGIVTTILSSFTVTSSGMLLLLWPVLIQQLLSKSAKQVPREQQQKRDKQRLERVGADHWNVDVSVAHQYGQQSQKHRKNKSHAGWWGQPLACHSTLTVRFKQKPRRVPGLVTAKWRD